MDGVTDNVEDHFKNKYQHLFNSANDGAELMKVQAETGALVDKKFVGCAESYTKI